MPQHRIHEGLVDPAGSVHKFVNYTKSGSHLIIKCSILDNIAICEKEAAIHQRSRSDDDDDDDPLTKDELTTEWGFQRSRGLLDCSFHDEGKYCRKLRSLTTREKARKREKQSRKECCCKIDQEKVLLQIEVVHKEKKATEREREGKECFRFCVLAVASSLWSCCREAAEEGEEEHWRNKTFRSVAASSSPVVEEDDGRENGKRSVVYVLLLVSVLVSAAAYGMRVCCGGRGGDERWSCFGAFASTIVKQRWSDTSGRRELQTLHVDDFFRSSVLFPRRLLRCDADAGQQRTETGRFPQRVRSSGSCVHQAQQRHGSCFQGFLLRHRVHTIATSLPTLRSHNASAHQACSSGEWKRWCVGRDEPVWVPSKCRRNGVVCTSQNQAKVCCNRAAASYKQNADVVSHRSFPRDNSLHHQEADCSGFALARADYLVLNGNPSVFLQRLRWDAQHHSKHAALHARPKPSWQAYLLLPRLRHAVGNRGFRGRLSLHCGGIAVRFRHTLCSSDQIQTCTTDCDAPGHRY